MFNILYALWLPTDPVGGHTPSPPSIFHWLHFDPPWMRSPTGSGQIFFNQNFSIFLLWHTKIWGPSSHSCSFVTEHTFSLDFYSYLWFIILIINMFINKVVISTNYVWIITKILNQVKNSVKRLGLSALGPHIYHSVNFSPS